MISLPAAPVLLSLRTLLTTSQAVLAAAIASALLVGSVRAADDVKAPPLTRTAKSGAWSAADTWEGGKLPAAKARVQIRPGHAVTYDIESEQVIRSIHVAGTLRFVPDKNTRLDVGLIKIQPGDDASENGFDCDAHTPDVKLEGERPALEVGAAARPIDAKFKALIRLTFVEGLDKETCPAIICCGGRMDLHGTPMSRTWVKLGATAASNSIHAVTFSRTSQKEGRKPRPITKRSLFFQSRSPAGRSAIESSSLRPRRSYKGGTNPGNTEVRVIRTIDERS